jgi:hypothetical protein
VKTRVLIDDMRTFRPRHDYIDFTARSVEGGIALLEHFSTRGFDQLWLDHDLGERTGKMETIMPVVEYLCDCEFDIGTIIINTANPVGGQAMQRALQDYYNVIYLGLSVVDDYLIVVSAPSGIYDL